MNPVALELQAIAVSLDPHVTPQAAPAPTRCGFGPGVYGSDLHHRYSLFYLSPDLFERTNSEFVNFLNQVLPHHLTNYIVFAPSLLKIQVFSPSCHWKSSQHTIEKGFGPAMRTGSSRQFKWLYSTIYSCVSGWVILQPRLNWLVDQPYKFSSRLDSTFCRRSTLPAKWFDSNRTQRWNRNRSHRDQSHLRFPQLPSRPWSSLTSKGRWWRSSTIRSASSSWATERP